ncbi:hypothetical protein L202_02748 [Cryptococcus amylolentus CBS 6039]|uniref:DNA repair protein rhp7 treble clef domain-containing protein n=2 Tax=Cryptococcus amylolentus TaxID=104669 RepID=A0A1E3HW38_9TREE|nr:hypothetical protein L202_02748 [Cryptococcus amylolentus CBS 6039]ODN80538.1 hypothetical protein L202_02748 [Cryptococcus amylolentus CBS 6039]ODO09126.1 hypothetical protein I350_02726 [Cryptococcus amylolentus CBS 6273]
MSRRARGGGAVRGPSSALTSFLAGLGVEPAHRVNTWGDRSTIEGNAIPEEGVVDPANAVTGETVEAGPSRVGEGTPVLDEPGDLPVGFKRGRGTDSEGVPTPKRSRAASIDSDDLDADDDYAARPSTSRAEKAPSKGVARGPVKAIGQFMDCGQCEKKFTVTAYTKEHPSQPQTWLCVQCSYALGIDPFAKPKKAAAKKAPKKDRAKIIHYEQKKGVKTLGDMCIGLIGKYIEDVEQLGDIGGINMDKVCRIICKGRRLTPETAPLFYAVDRTSLDMFDCTRLDPPAYLALANLNPNLTSLRLDLVGQLSTDAVSHWAKTLTKLTRLELLGPFLVRKPAWLELFRALGEQLEGFLITQSPRIDVETVKELVERCPNLTEIRLKEVILDNDMLAELAKLKKLRSLDLSSPAVSLTDEPVIELIQAVGGGLETLDLTDNAELTDDILPIIAEHCPQLKNLHLRNVTELSNEAIAAFFKSLKQKQRPGLEVIDLEKGHECEDLALRELIAHSGESVQWLSILGWRQLSIESLQSLTQCKHAKYIDVGWCRQVNNFLIKDLLDGCPALEQLRVWGCNNLSSGVPRRQGVKVIGIETHSI